MNSKSLGAAYDRVRLIKLSRILWYFSNGGSKRLLDTFGRCLAPSGRW